MKMLQKVSFMALVAMVLILGTQCDSLADSGVMRYRVTQNGATITPRISFAADRLRTIPRPPNKRCGKAAGTISGAVQIPIDTDDSSGVACCYSLVKGFWQHAGNAEFHQGAGYVVLPVLILNDDSVVKVESATGSKLSDVPVRVVNPIMRNEPISADVDSMWLPETDGRYLESYSMLFNDHSSYTFKSDMKTDSLGSYHFNVPASYPLQAIYAAKYKGFWHYSQENITSFPANRTLIMPAESSLTLNYLGNKPANIQVMIADPIDDSKLLTADRFVTNAAGVASYAIPAGTSFRFAYRNDQGNLLYSSVLTAPFNGSVIVRARNNPELLAPADNANFSTGQMVSFDWGNTLNAAKYLWFYRHNDGSWYYMDRQGYTQLNISGFPNVGKWDWMVMALDSAGNVIAQSEERTINITAATTSAVSKRSLAVASISKESCEVLDFSKKVEDLNLPSGIVIADKDKK